MDKTIATEIDKHQKELEQIDQSTMHCGVFQAVCQLRQALNQVEKALNDRDFEKASSLGYREVASEFVFLQRTLGGLQECVIDRQKLIQDIACETQSAYEEVAPLLEQQMDSLKPGKKSEVVDISIGEQSIEKLNELHQIRGTKIEDIIEHIVATGLKENASYWQQIEQQKPAKKTKRDESGGVSAQDMDGFFQEMQYEMQQRMDNLY